MDTNFYNAASASKLGWTASWFDAEGFDEKLARNVRKFQKEHQLKADGLVGPITYRRIYTLREVEEDMQQEANPAGSDYILCNGKEVAVGWDKIITFNEEGAFVLPEDCYKSVSSERKPIMVVTHWDAALSAKSCHRILKKRGISSHFVIDNDGTIFQMVDTNHVAWHAGKVNSFSIGIDFSNAYYTKYQSWYTKNNFGRRPVLESSVVHGSKLKPHLGYYQVQLDAYSALVKALCEHYDIPLDYPQDKENNYLTTVHKPALSKKFSGVVCHFNLSKKKIDCAGLDLKKVIEDIRD